MNFIRLFIYSSYCVCKLKIFSMGHGSSSTEQGVQVLLRVQVDLIHLKKIIINVPYSIAKPDVFVILNVKMNLRMIGGGLKTIILLALI